MVHEHKAAALPCVVGCEQLACGQGREQGTSSRVWAASVLRHSAHCLAQACGASRAASASSRATSATPSVDRSRAASASSHAAASCDERKLACGKGRRAASVGSHGSSAGKRAQRALARVHRALARAASTSSRVRLMPCDGEQQRCDAAHGLRAHGQRWLCACGPWACVAWDCCVAIRSF